MKPKQKQVWFILFTAIVWTAFAAFGEEPNALTKSWLAAQSSIHSWQADFVQTRTLKSLTRPLTSNGHVWFEAPNRFRWELGHPPQTIAVRAPAELLVIYPRLKRVERYPLTGETGAWRDALSLLEAGFPRNQAELDSQYTIVAQNVSDGGGEVSLQPKSPAALRMMPLIKIGFDTSNFSLRSTELQFADGSTMRNDFKNQVLNPTIDAQMFTPQISPDYKVIEPLKK